MVRVRQIASLHAKCNYTCMMGDFFSERMRGVISEHEAQKENEAKEGENHEQSIGELTQKLRQAQEHHEAFVIKRNYFYLQY